MRSTFKNINSQSFWTKTKHPTKSQSYVVRFEYNDAKYRSTKIRQNVLCVSNQLLEKPLKNNIETSVQNDIKKTNDSSENILTIFFITFVVVLGILAKKKDGRTKTGYKDNNIPMNLFIRIFIALVVALGITIFSIKVLV